MAVFDIVFGWRKASKCKKLIRRVQCRLRLLRNKRDSIVRQSRGDIAVLVQMGHFEIAVQRAEQLRKDESVKELYDLLDHFCEFIVTNLSYIRQQRECPNDVNEAVSSLIFASARCGELPELLRIRELFRERYGERFTVTAVDLLPGNLVNSKIRDHLSMKSIPDDSKFRLVDEFAREQLKGVPIRPEILAIEYASELHQQREGMAEQQAICLDIVPIGPETIADLEEEDFTASEVGNRDISTDLVAMENVLQVATSQSTSPRLTNPESPKISSFALAASPYKLTTAVSCSVEKESGAVTGKAAEKREGSVTSLSVKSSPHFPKLKVAYLDDVEELQSRPKHHGEGLDQRFFKFIPSVIPKSTNPKEIVANRYAKQCKPLEEENLSPRVSGKNEVMPGRRLRWRSVSREPKTTDGLEYSAYYNPRKHLEQSTTKVHDQSLNPKPKYDSPLSGKVTSVQQGSHCHCCVHGKMGDHKVFYAIPNNGKGIRGRPDITPDDSLDTDASTSSDSGEEDGLLLPSYSRAMTMPPKRPTLQQPEGKDGGRMPRSNSCPFQCQPNHVHPKLPDYDELTARFSALKEEYLTARPKPCIGRRF